MMHVNKRISLNQKNVVLNTGYLLVMAVMEVLYGQTK